MELMKMKKKMIETMTVSLKKPKRHYCGTYLHLQGIKRARSFVHLYTVRCTLSAPRKEAGAMYLYIIACILCILHLRDDKSRRSVLTMGGFTDPIVFEVYALSSHRSFEMRNICSFVLKKK